MNKKNNILILEHNLCVGCRSCVLSCPKNCISFTADDEGFFYPSVNEEVCVGCGLCIKHCPILSQKTSDNAMRTSYAMWVNNEMLLAQSSSGGAFTAFAENILEENGIVFGAAFDEVLHVNQIHVTNKASLSRLKGSKYVSSNTQQSFREAEYYLKSGKKVLYSGTPCQIAGLKSFLGKEYDNLYTLDLICHGVPSQKLFDTYLQFLGDRLHGKIVYYGFRDKDIGGWSCGGKAIAKTKTKTKTIEALCDPYYASFLHCETYRESCYSCKYANMNRVGDITIGDYFEGTDFYPQLEGIKGVSLCIVNTVQGKILFESSTDKISFIPVDEKNYVGIKGNLTAPSPRPDSRNYIYKGISSLSVEDFFSQFVYMIFSYKCKYYIKKIVKRILPKQIIQQLKGYK